MSLVTRERLISTVRELPALPAVVHELIEMLGQEGIASERLAERIARDPALSAKTLRLANSSFFAMPRPVASVADAIAVLGLRTMRGIVTAAAVTGAFERPLCPGFDFIAFWRHALATAVCARELAADDADDGFIVGLLHDIGRLLLVSGFPDDYGKVLRHQSGHDATPQECERVVLGVDHAEAGAMLARRWRFPERLCDAIAAHHEPDACVPGTLAARVHVADNIVHALDLSGLENDVVPPLSSAAWLAMKLDVPGCELVFRATEAQTRAVCAALLV